MSLSQLTHNSQPWQYRICRISRRIIVWKWNYPYALRLRAVHVQTPRQRIYSGEDHKSDLMRSIKKKLIIKLNYQV